MVPWRTSSGKLYVSFTSSRVSWSFALTLGVMARAAFFSPWRGSSDRNCVCEVSIIAFAAVNDGVVFTPCAARYTDLFDVSGRTSPPLLKWKFLDENTVVRCILTLSGCLTRACMCCWHLSHVLVHTQDFSLSADSLDAVSAEWSTGARTVSVPLALGVENGRQE